MRSAAHVQSGGGVRVWHVQLSCGSALHAAQARCGPRVSATSQARAACVASSQSLPRHLQVVATCDVILWQNACLYNTQAHANRAAGRLSCTTTKAVSLERWNLPAAAAEQHCETPRVLASAHKPPPAAERTTRRKDVARAEGIFLIERPREYAPSFAQALQCALAH